MRLLRTAFSAVLMFTCLGLLSPAYGQQDSASDEDKGGEETSPRADAEDFLRHRLDGEALAEKLETARIERQKKLPGGIFKAPRIHRQLKQVIKEFQQTKFVDDHAVFEIFLASTPEINGWVAQVQDINDLKVYHVMVTKGLIDAICDYAGCQGQDRKGTSSMRGSMALLAAVVAHEFGHAMNNDLEKLEKHETNGVFFEFNADIFGTELLAASGYDPEAMIHLLTMLGDLHKQKSLSSLVAQMLDAHPKANYRIANIEPTVSVLKAPGTLLETSEPIRYEQRYKIVDVDRSGPEKTSRTSLSGFEKFRQSQRYQQLGYDEKLRALERYLVFHPNTGRDAMSLRMYVAIVNEYGRTLSDADNLASVDAFIASLRRFEDQLGGMGSATHHDSGRNVKRALRRVRSHIVEKQLQYLNLQDLNLDSVRTWGREVDYQLVAGALTKIINQSATEGEIRLVVDYLLNYEQGMQERHNWLRSPEHQSFRDNRQRIFEAASVRYLHLTKNLEETLNFVHLTMPLTRSDNDENATSETFRYIMAGLVHYCLTHNDVDYGRFHERMDNPKSAEDRNFAALIHAEKNNTANVLFNRRGLGRSPDPTSRTFSYNIGRRYLGFEDIDPATVMLIQRTLPTQAINIVFNDLIKTRYSFAEALDLIANLPASDAEFWQRHRRELLRRNPGKSFRELPVQLKAIEASLRAMGVSGFEWPALSYTKAETFEFLTSASSAEVKSLWPKISAEYRVFDPKRRSLTIAENLARMRDFLSQYDVGVAEAVINQTERVQMLGELTRLLADIEGAKLAEHALLLNTTYKRSAAIVNQNLKRIYSRFLRSPTFRQNNEKHPAKGHAPHILDRWVQKLSMEERIGLLEDMFKTQAEETITEYGPKFLEIRTSLESALTELVTEEKISNSAKSEYLESYDRLKELSVLFLEGRLSDLPAEYFVAQRTLRLQTQILVESSSGFSSKISTDTMRVLVGALNEEARRVTAPSVARRYVNRMMLMDKQAALRYLQDPHGNSKLTQTFQAISELAALVAHYEGLSTVENADAMEALSIRNTLVRTVFDPTVKPSKTKAGVNHRPKLRSSLLLNEAEQSVLLRLGPGFKKIFEDEAVRTGDRTLESKVYSGLLQDLWPFQMRLAIESSDPRHGLVHTLAHMAGSSGDTGEEKVRTQYVLLTRALANVETAEQMEFFVSVFARYLSGHSIGAQNGQELLNADLRKLMDLAAARYREYFYDRLVNRMNFFDIETGQPNGVKVNYLNLKTRFLVYLSRKAWQYERPYGVSDKDRPFIFRTWLLRNSLLPALADSHTYRQWWQHLQRRLGERYTESLLQRGESAGSFSLEEFYKAARNNTPWSAELDRAIAEYIRAGELEGWKWSGDRKRSASLDLVKKIRSLNLRQEMYDYVLETYGEPKTGVIQKVKNWWNLYRAYKHAEAIWTASVLEQLKQAQSMFAAFKITEQAWEDHANKRCSRIGVSKEDAYQRLLSLHEAKQKVENPYGAEVAAVFPEGSRHRDEFLERHAKRNPKTYEQLEMLEEFKSKNATTPYHKIAKALFELLDEHVTRLAPDERARVALYLADFETELDEHLDQKLRKIFHGSRNRRKAIRTRGVYFSLEEIKQLFLETHAEERALAFQSLFAGTDGISENPDAEKLLVERLLFADQGMPDYLKRVLQIYIDRIDRSDRSILLSYMLANCDGKELTGPEVLKMIVEKGGAVAAKMAQLIASHGFKLPSEYQVVLEVFKGKAQNVDKIVAMKWISERLPREKYKQIAHVDQELGSGSLKLAVLATLRDGRKVVIKLAREYAKRKVVRELSLLREIVADVQADPALRIEGLENLGGEVERIILDEMDFSEEFRLEREHKEASKERPLLVRLFGNNVQVYYPQPLEGWQSKDILVEEYVEAASWNDLPESGLFGWTKERLAKAAINEVLNQLWSVLNENERREDGMIIVDIDPHEENQLAKRSWLGRRKMVNIDLGQSVRVHPETVRGIARIVYQIDAGELQQAAKLAEEFLNLDSQESSDRFLSELQQQADLSSDALEIFTKALEEVEIEGIALKPEYLFFQKLFATLVGLKRHVNDPNYLTKQTKKIIVLRALTHPKEVLKEYSWMKQGGRAGGDCPGAFLK